MIIREEKLIKDTCLLEKIDQEYIFKYRGNALYQYTLKELNETYSVNFNNSSEFEKVIREIDKHSFTELILDLNYYLSIDQHLDISNQATPALQAIESTFQYLWSLVSPLEQIEYERKEEGSILVSFLPNPKQECVQLIFTTARESIYHFRFTFDYIKKIFFNKIIDIDFILGLSAELFTDHLISFYLYKNNVLSEEMELEITTYNRKKKLELFLSK